MELEELNKRQKEIYDRLEQIRCERDQENVSGKLKQLEEERSKLTYELFTTLQEEAESKGYVKDYDTDKNHVLWKKKDSE
jgi:hypothetical protein